MPTIEEVRVKQCLLEDEIRKLVYTFEKENDVFVELIELDHVDFLGEDGLRKLTISAKTIIKI